MSTNLIPSNIAEIIERKRQTLLEARWQKEEAEQRERQEAEAIGHAKYDEYIQAALLKVPEYLRQYVLPTEDVPDFYRIGKGWNTPGDWLYFEIPGLAKILFAPQAKDSPWKYQTASPYEQKYSYDGDTIHMEPSLNFSDRQYGWTDDLDYALGCAQAELQKYQKYVAEYAAQQEEIAKEAKQREADAAKKETRNQEAQARRDLEQQQEQTEERALFEAIKSDPIALNMLKAFVLLRDERSSFQEQLENADWTIYNMEERHSRRATELRRQADEAERRALDEHSRLQSDLDDAEAKLKKAERGW
jgi:hypothetical protein